MPGYKLNVQQTWYSFYDLDLGESTATCETRDGGFWRTFAKGAVAVNPGQQPVTISLPRSYRALDGEQVEQLSLGPKQASIVTLGDGALK